MINSEKERERDFKRKREKEREGGGGGGEGGLADLTGVTVGTLSRSVLDQVEEGR